MTRFSFVTGVMPLLLVTACTSAEERAARADEEVANRRLELIEQHQECVEQAEGDQAKVQTCETYLKEAEALK